MTPSLLLVGATGTIGSLLLRQLIDRHVRVRVLVPDEKRIGRLSVHSFVEVVAGTLEDPIIIDAALSGIDRVFMLTPPAPNQVLLQGNLIEVAERTGRPVHVVTVSPLGGMPAHVSLRVGRWQTVTEAQLRSSGLPTTILRPQFLMQNFLRIAPAIQVDNLLCGAFGAARFPFVDARDVAAVATSVLTGDGHVGQSYYLTGPQALSYAEVAATFSSVLGRSIHYVDMPVEAYHEYLLGSGVEVWMAEDLAALARSVQREEPASISSTVPAVTGRPARTLSQFIREHASFFAAGDSVHGGAMTPCTPLLWPTASPVEPHRKEEPYQEAESSE